MSPLLTLLAAGCAMIDGATFPTDDPWDPNVVPLADGTYVRLPAAGALLRIAPDGALQDVDLDAAIPDELLPSPDGTQVLAFSRWASCDLDDPRIDTVEACEEEDREALTWHRELHVVADGESRMVLDVPEVATTLTFDHAGDRAVAWLDWSRLDEDTEFSGLVNLYEVAFVDLVSGESTSVSLDFQPEQVLFSPDDARALLLYRSTVTVFDAATAVQEVGFNLGLDVSDVITPEDAGITGDGRYALVSVREQPELYVLDLVGESINIVDLDDTPSDMAVDPVLERTVLVYGDRLQADVVDHALFDVTTLDLEAPMNRVLSGDGFVLLYNDASNAVRSVYRLDPLTGKRFLYQTENPVSRLYLAPDQQRAVAVTRPDGDGDWTDSHWGVEILDLVDDRGGAIRLAAAAEPVALAFAGDAEALLLLAGSTDLLRLDLATGDTEPLDLPDAALTIGATPDDRFVIGHDAPLGLLSYVSPESGAIEQVAGFAAREVVPDGQTPLRPQE